MLDAAFSHCTMCDARVQAGPDRRLTPPVLKLGWVDDVVFSYTTFDGVRLTFEVPACPVHRDELRALAKAGLLSGKTQMAQVKAQLVAAVAAWRAGMRLGR